MTFTKSRQYPKCYDTNTRVPTHPSGLPRHRHPHQGRLCIGVEEFNDRVWTLIARTDCTVAEANRRVSLNWQPVATGKRTKDGLELQRAKRRITPLEAQRHILNYMNGRYSRTRGGPGPYSKLRRGSDFPIARSYVMARYCVMGTWEDLQAYGDACSIHWAEWKF